MNAQAILQIVAQAVALLPTLITVGMDVTKRIQQIYELSKAGAEGTATPEMVKAIRDQLDADLASFNEPLPPE